MVICQNAVFFVFFYVSLVFKLVLYCTLMSPFLSEILLFQMAYIGNIVHLDHCSVEN